MVIVMLLMGVFSPIWMKAIDIAGVDLAKQPALTEPASQSTSLIDTQPQISAAQEATK